MIAPAIGSWLSRWTGDESQFADARTHLDETVAALAAAGITARGETGADDPLQAADDGLREFPAHEIVFVTKPGTRHRLGRAGVVEAARKRYSVPVTHIGSAPARPERPVRRAVAGEAQVRETPGLRRAAACAPSEPPAMLAALAVASTAPRRKVLMATAAVLFVPGAYRDARARATVRRAAELSASCDARSCSRSVTKGPRIARGSRSTGPETAGRRREQVPHPRDARPERRTNEEETMGLWKARSSRCGSVDRGGVRRNRVRKLGRRRRASTVAVDGREAVRARVHAEQEDGRQEGQWCSASRTRGSSPTTSRSRQEDRVEFAPGEDDDADGHVHEGRQVHRISARWRAMRRRDEGRADLK